MLDRLSTLASLFGVSIAGSPPSPNGIYCGSSDHWSTIVLVVNSTAGTLTASGTAKVPDDASWTLADVPFKMDAFGTEMVISEAPMSIRAFELVTAPVIPPPFGYQLGFDTLKQAIVPTYDGTQLSCTTDQCPGGHASDDEAFGPKGVYCCSNKDWNYLQFKAYKRDGEAGLLDISGETKSSNFTGLPMYGVPFYMAKDTLMVLGLNSSLKTLAFDANTKTITAFYGGKKIDFTLEKCADTGSQ
ncbi:hypothetical protein FOZ60_003801 [Perkinsus olseni]|uniref:Uncharacterized protein n=1 Tax=Perkinsus olseni TaxID=32597 RepID=A0A7J6NVH4_PEROL|nr:hypothetical protein FOZ60_003801 [Perkinsus olseni]